MQMEKQKKEKKKSSNLKYYFTNEVDQAIVVYNESNQLVKKNILYNNTIYPALDKLSENMINTLKFDYLDLPYEDLKHELVVFLTEKLDKFKAESGKAFSYFSIVARNYLIAKNKKGYEVHKNKVELCVVDEERNIAVELSVDHYRDSLFTYMEEWIEEKDAQLYEIFPDHHDAAIADSILEIFRDRKTLDSFNKKALYILIRERVGIKTQRITKVLSILKDDFYLGFQNYLK